MLNTKALYETYSDQMKSNLGSGVCSNFFLRSSADNVHYLCYMGLLERAQQIHPVIILKAAWSLFFRQTLSTIFRWKGGVRPDYGSMTIASGTNTLSKYLQKAIYRRSACPVGKMTLWLSSTMGLYSVYLLLLFILCARSSGLWSPRPFSDL